MCNDKVLTVHTMKAYRGGGYVALSILNTLRTGDADLRFYVTTLQDG